MSIDSGPAGVIFKNDFSVINWIATVSANIGGAYTPLLGGPKAIDTNHMAHSEFGDLVGAGVSPRWQKNVIGRRARRNITTAVGSELNP